MPYLGNQAGNRFVASKAATQFSGDGSTTAFTLDHAVGSDEDILVSVDGVIQEPSVAYAVSNGTTLTFTAAPSNNSGNNIFVYYLFRTVGTVDHPSTSSLQATDGTFSSTLNVTGETTLATHLNMGDNDIIKVGAGSDIQIYHDGSYSRIMESGGTGFVLDTTSTDIRLTADNSEVMGKFIKNGAVQLFHDNSQKLSTTSSGVTITGAVNIGGTGTANALDDYEEGNWTPSVGGNTTYDNQIGRYVKIGNKVTLWFYIQINQRNSPSVPYIAGTSPFTNSSSITGSGLVHYFEGINNNAVVLTARIDPGGSNINISGSTGSAATVANVNHDWVKNGGDIYGFVTHYTG